jgi:aspartate/methionine/tyrosine aminotransferase
MNYPESKLERFFAQWEFVTEHILCASDVDPYSLRELLALADEDCAARWDGLLLGYTETSGHPALREAIAGLYEKTSPDGIVVCGGGAAEALFLVTNVLLDPGAHAVVVAPAFEPLYRVAAALGAEVTLVPLDAGTGWALDLDAVRTAIRPRTSIIAVNFPHNPTGALLDHGTWLELVTLAEERGITLVSDEVYRFMEFDPERRLPAAADISARAVSVGVMSKAYGLAGLRIGWVASADHDLLTRITALKDYTSVCSSAPSEILALIALRNHDRIVERCLRIVTGNLAHADAFFGSWKEIFEWVRPEGGTVGFPRLNAPIQVDQFVSELVRQEGVLLLPGTFFGDSSNRFRIGLGRRTLPAALERLDAFTGRRLT